MATEYRGNQFDKPEIWKITISFAFNILHDKQDSEECQNDTYNAVWNAIPPARPRGFPAFITQIIRHIAYDRYKERNRQKRVPSELTVSIDELYTETGIHMTTEADCEAAELAKLLDSFLNGLDERGHLEFVGRYYMAESVESIAADLGVTVSTVYRDLAAMRTQLKNYLETNGVSI